MEGTVRRDRRAVVATAAVAGAVVALGLVALAHDWSPVSDWALLENRVRDVGGAHTPLVGAYSRFGWNHPGPWGFWLLAVPYRLVGAQPEGLLLGASLLNAGAVVGAARVAFRRGGTALTLLALAGLVLFLSALGPSLLVDPWNPWLTVVPGCWALLLAWDVACGHRWSIPVLLAVGSFLVQVHVGVAVLVAVVTALAVVAALVRPADDPGEAAPPWGRVAIVAAAVVVLAWAPVLADQVTADDGNVGQLVDFFLGDGADDAVDFYGNPAERVGHDEAARILARETAAWAPWSGAAEPLDLLGQVQGRDPFLLALPVALLAATATVGVRLGRRSLVAGAALGGAALVASWLAIAAILGTAAEYLVRWVQPVAFFVHLLAGWALLLVVRRRWTLPPVTATIATGVLVAWSAALLVVGAATLDPPRDEFAGAVEALVEPAVAWAEDGGSGPIVVRSDGGGPDVLAALVDALDRAGEDPQVAGPLAATFPPHQRWEGAAAAQQLVVAGADDRARLEADRGLVVAEHPGVEGDERQPPLAVVAVAP